MKPKIETNRETGTMRIDDIEFNEKQVKVLNNFLGAFEKQITNQVCEEMREKLPYYKYSFQEPEVPRVDVIEIRDIEFILDQLEQAKEKKL